MALREAYTAALQALLPPGRAWPRTPGAVLTRLLSACAATFERLDLRALDLRNEADPRAARESLPEWERVCGLPDVCSAGLATTLQERRAAVVAKLTAQGGASKVYFIALALRMGYVIEIDEFRPFVASVSRCGERLNGGAAVRHIWRVRVIGPRQTLFRTGVSQAGDRLLKIDRAADLECKLKRLKPAHTRVVMSYQGV